MTANNKKKHYDQIDALKGMAIFLVVLGHSIVVYPINLHEIAIFEFAYKWLSSVHMPLFFIVSGFCFSYKNNYKQYLRKKINRILAPYIVFNCIDLLSRTLLPSLVNRTGSINASIIKIVLNGGEYWFLYTLFIIFVIYPFLYKNICTSSTKTLALLASSVYIAHFVKLPNIFTLDRVSYYIFFFTLGVIIRKEFGYTIFNVRLNKIKIAIGLFATMGLWFLMIMLDKPELDIVSGIVGIVFMYLLSQFNCIVRTFKDVGKFSLQLYLLNGYMLVISRTVGINMLNISNPFLIVGFNMLVDFLISYLVIRYFLYKVELIRRFMGF